MAPPGGAASGVVTTKGPGADAVRFDTVAPEEFDTTVTRLGPGSFEVSIVVPETAREGNLLDVILVGSDAAETTVVLRAIVDPEAPFVARTVAADKESPGGYALLGLVVLAGVVLAARRK